MPGDVVIYTPKKFAKFANETSNMNCLFFQNSCWQNLKKSQKQPQYQQPWRFTRSSRWRRGICLQTSFTIWVRIWSSFLLESIVYNVDIKQKISPTTFATIVKMNMLGVKNGFNALSVLSGTMKGAYMNRSLTFSSSYFIYSILIVTQSCMDFSCCILCLHFPFHTFLNLLDGKKYCRSRVQTTHWEAN